MARMTLDCSPAVKGMALAWLLLPLAGAVVPMLLTHGVPAPIVQEGRTSFVFMGAIGGAWLLLGLSLVPLLGLHGSSLAKALLMAVAWSAVTGAWWGPTVVELAYRPPAWAAGEPAEFLPSRRAGHMVKVSPISGEAASARFLVPQAWWNEAYARAGNRPVKGRVYKGRGNLWFARLE
jgi:hypothetical protein